MTSSQSPFLASSTLEKVLEYRFIADLTSRFWLSGEREFEILRSDVDSHGYDLVVEAWGVTRHVQLKAMIKGGKRRNVNINLRLANKPSGCVVWFVYDPETLALGPFMWFGGLPGEKLPDAGERSAKHTKANAHGKKTDRPHHRIVSKSRFQSVETLDDLVRLLFVSDG